jgi:hypothetical protein
LYWWISSVVLFVCCKQDIFNRAKPADPLIAQVFDTPLHSSDLAGYIPVGTTTSDSLELVRSFAIRWVKKQIMLRNAEINLSGELDVEKLTKDYRESLLLLNFEQRLVAQQLDSTISQQALTEFYQKNKDQYQLESSIVRCLFMKLPRKHPDLKKVREWWEKPDDANRKKLVSLCTKANAIFILEDSSWHKSDEVEALFPDGRVNVRSWRNGEDWTLTDSDYIYFMRIIEVVATQEAAPLSYVSQEAKKVILNKRKGDIVSSFNEKLYETELRKNNIKIYVK